MVLTKRGLVRLKANLQVFSPPVDHFIADLVLLLQDGGLGVAAAQGEHTEVHLMEAASAVLAGVRLEGVCLV